MLQIIKVFKTKKRLAVLLICFGIGIGIGIGIRLSDLGRSPHSNSYDQSRISPPEDTPLSMMMEKLRPLHQRKHKPGVNDWLANHEETGQTFVEYRESNPVTPRGDRTILYIQPLGEFTPTERKIIDLTAEFMEIYFSRPVKIQEDLPLSLIPEDKRRFHGGSEQINSIYVLDDVLKPRLPADAAAFLAFTASDLYPEDSWNFVYGQASLKNRVGVWSIHRNGDPDESQEAYLLCLLRTLKTATHETGHMFSIKHCTAYECNMCGSNHRVESDNRPLACCPECMAKICWGTEADPVERYQRLAEFCEKNGLTPEQTFYEKLIQALLSNEGDPPE